MYFFCIYLQKYTVVYYVLVCQDISPAYTSAQSHLLHVQHLLFQTIPSQSASIFLPQAMHPHLPLVHTVSAGGYDADHEQNKKFWHFRSALPYQYI